MDEQKDQNKPLRLLIPVCETAAMLSVSEKTVYRLIKRGLLKAPRALRHKMVTTSSIRAFAEAAV